MQINSFEQYQEVYQHSVNEPEEFWGTIAENLAANRSIKGLALAVAAWMRYVGGVDEKGEAIDVRDPLAARLKALSDGAASPKDKVEALLSVREIFPASLAENPTFASALMGSYESLATKGARRTIEELQA